MNPERERYEERERDFSPGRGKRGAEGHQLGRSGWDPEPSYPEGRERGSGWEREGRGDGRREAGYGQDRRRWEGREAHGSGERSSSGRQYGDEWGGEPGPYTPSRGRPDRDRGDWTRRGQDDPGAYGSEAWYGSEGRGGRFGRGGEEHGPGSWREGDSRQLEGRGSYGEYGPQRGAFGEYSRPAPGFERGGGRWGEIGRQYQGGDPESRFDRSWERGGRESGPYVGRGPKGYQRPDERVREDVCERLTQHGSLDASDIEIKVERGEVTLTGTVGDRQAKRLAEDLIEETFGVKQVHNQLRISNGGRSEPAGSGTASAGTGSTSGEGSPRSESRAAR
jgi:hypothetical protein